MHVLKTASSKTLTNRVRVLLMGQATLSTRLPILLALSALRPMKLINVQKKAPHLTLNDSTDAGIMTVTEALTENEESTDQSALSNVNSISKYYVNSITKCHCTNHNQNNVPADHKAK